MRHLNKIISAFFAIFLTTSLLAQVQTHSSVINGVKTRFQSASSNPGDAEKIYSDAIKLLVENNVIRDTKEKEKAETYYWLGACYSKMNESEKAVEAFDKSLTFSKKYLEEGEKVSGGIKVLSIKEFKNDMKFKMYNQANRAFNDGKSASPDSMKVFFYKAIDKFTQVMKLDSSVTINGTSYRAPVYGTLVNIFIMMMNNETEEGNRKPLREKVIENLAVMTSFDKNNFSLYYNIIALYQQEKNYDKVIEWTDKALKVDSKDSVTITGKSQLIAQKALILDVQGKSELALNTYLEALKADPNNADLHFNLARLYFSKNKNDEAIAELRLVKKLKPEDVESNFQVADEAFFAYQKKRSQAIEKSGTRPDMKKVMDQMKADNEECKTLVLEAITAMDKALALSSDKTEANYRIGKFYNLLAELSGQMVIDQDAKKVAAQKPYFEKAVSYLKQAVTLTPNHLNAWQNLWITYTNLQMKKESNEAMKKFEELSKGK